MLKAIIFDFDGVILDTAEKNYLSYKHIFLQLGINYLREEFNLNFGMRTKDHLNDVLKKSGFILSEEELDELVLKRDEFYRKRWEGSIEMLPGMESILKELKENNIKIAIASLTHRNNLDFFIEKLGLKEYIDNSVAGNEVSAEKPSPEIYLKACSELGVSPDLCVGVEDTEKGVASLRGAGIKSIAVTLTNTKKHNFSNANLVVSSLEQINLKKLLQLLF